MHSAARLKGVLADVTVWSIGVEGFCTYFVGNDTVTSWCHAGSQACMRPCCRASTPPLPSCGMSTHALGSHSPSTIHACTMRLSAMQASCLHITLFMPPTGASGMNGLEEPCSIVVGDSSRGTPHAAPVGEIIYSVGRPSWAFFSP